tara:strand:- start:13549 stop:15933 length:2385 start_codon:yes stop_codon:yes gene_type:complete
MSNLKVNANLFLGNPELTKLQRFLGAKAQDFIKARTYFPGIVRSIADTSLGNFSTSVSTTTGSIALNSVTSNTAIDVDGNIITLPSNANIVIPSTGAYYWVSISYQTSTEEVGTISVSADGKVTGIGTKFTEALRGVPNHSSVIRITGSLNAEDYHIVRVIDDENAILSGTGFTVEATMKYSVVGTFTPGITAPETSKLIFEYDNCEVAFTVEPALNTQPALTTAETGRKFFIARVFYDGSTVTIDDKRSDFWWDRSTHKDNYVAIGKAGKIVGVESVKWDAPNTTQDTNLVKVGWGFRCSSYTVDPTSRTITLNSGEGGYLRSSDQFITGMFTGYRVYRDDGNYDTIVSSSSGAGSQILIRLDVLDPDNYQSPNEITITPQAEEIELWVKGDQSATDYTQLDKKYSFSMGSGSGVIPVKHPTPSAAYNISIQWRYKNNQHYTPWDQLPTTSVGFYNEASFDANGVLNTNPIDRTIVPVTSSAVAGYIPLTPSPTHYQSLLGTVAIGDVLKVNKRELNVGLTSVILTAGTDEAVQVFTGSNKALGSDIVISLSQTNANEGNSFTIIFDMATAISSGGNEIRIEDNATGIASGALLYSFTDADFSYCGYSNKRVSFVAYYDADTTSWTLTKTEGDSASVGDIKMITGFNPITDFSAAGLGLTDKYLGWALCNGSNGTENLVDKFVKGAAALTGAGATGGSATATITEANLPAHDHNFNDPGHDHILGDYDRILKHDGNGTGQGFDSNDTSGSEPNLQLSVVMPTSSTGITMDSQGSGTPMSIEPEYIVLGFIQRI